VQEKQQTKKEVTREKNQQLILAAAEKLFSELGYDGASMSKIAKEAALPKANVLYYFKNKDNLYEAVLDNILAEWNLGLDNVSVEDDPAIVLYNYIKNKVILAVEKPVPSRLFASEMIRGAPYLQDYLQKSTRPWIQAKYNLFLGWIAAGKMDKVDPNHLLFAIWSTTQYYADFQTEVLLVLDKPAYEEKDVIAITQSIAQIILKGIGLQIPEHLAQ
jgi:TetR/AcrR family transcriptional regulator